MKIRSNYVSNSSSSSYIIQFYSLQDQIINGWNAVSIEDFFDHIRFYYRNDENEMYCLIDKDSEDKKGIQEERKEFIEYINGKLNRYRYSPDKIELLKKVRERISSDKNSNFAYVDLGHHDAIGHFILKMLQNNNFVKVLYMDN